MTADAITTTVDTAESVVFEDKSNNITAVTVMETITAAELVTTTMKAMTDTGAMVDVMEVTNTQRVNTLITTTENSITMKRTSIISHSHAPMIANEIMRMNTHSIVNRTISTFNNHHNDLDVVAAADADG